MSVENKEKPLLVWHMTAKLIVIVIQFTELLLERRIAGFHIT